MARLSRRKTQDNGNNSATAALSNIAQSLAGSSAKIVPNTLIDAGPYDTMTVGQKPKSAVSVSAFNLLSAASALANGSNTIATAVNLSLPGIASVTMQATMGARPAGTSWVTVGSQGATVQTAQTRVLLKIALIGSGAVSVVNLPVYVEIAQGTAVLQSVACGYPNVNTSTVALGVSPGIVDAWIGNVTSADMSNMAAKPNPPAANVVNLGVVQVTGLAHATMANTAATNVSFSYSDIQAQTRKTVSTTSYTSSPDLKAFWAISLCPWRWGPWGFRSPASRRLVTSIIGGGNGVDRHAPGDHAADAGGGPGAGRCLGHRHPLRRRGAGELISLLWPGLTRPSILRRTDGYAGQARV